MLNFTRNRRLKKAHERLNLLSGSNVGQLIRSTYNAETIESTRSFISKAHHLGYSVVGIKGIGGGIIKAYIKYKRLKITAEFMIGRKYASISMWYVSPVYSDTRILDDTWTPEEDVRLLSRFRDSYNSGELQEYLSATGHSI